jgi:hypothetical protein
LSLRHILPHRHHQYQQRRQVCVIASRQPSACEAAGMDIEDDSPGPSADETRRSVLPWPDPVRSAPGRWTLVASWATVVVLAAAALFFVIARM